MRITVETNTIVFDDVDAYEPPEEVDIMSDMIAMMLGINLGETEGSHDKRQMKVFFEPEISEDAAEEMTQKVQQHRTT